MHAKTRMPWFERNQKIKSEPWRTVISIERHGSNFHFTWDDHTEVVPVTRPPRDSMS